MYDWRSSAWETVGVAAVAAVDKLDFAGAAPHGGKEGWPVVVMGGECATFNLGVGDFCK